MTQAPCLVSLPPDVLRIILAHLDGNTLGCLQIASRVFTKELVKDAVTDAAYNMGRAPPSEAAVTSDQWKGWAHWHDQDDTWHDQAENHDQRKLWESLKEIGGLYRLTGECPEYKGINSVSMSGVSMAIYPCEGQSNELFGFIGVYSRCYDDDMWDEETAAGEVAPSLLYGWQQIMIFPKVGLHGDRFELGIAPANDPQQHMSHPAVNASRLWVQFDDIDEWQGGFMPMAYFVKEGSKFHYDDDASISAGACSVTSRGDICICTPNCDYLGHFLFECAISLKATIGNAGAVMENEAIYWEGTLPSADEDEFQLQCEAHEQGCPRGDDPMLAGEECFCIPCGEPDAEDGLKAYCRECFERLGLHRASGEWKSVEDLLTVLVGGCRDETESTSDSSGSAPDEVS